MKRIAISASLALSLGAAGILSAIAIPPVLAQSASTQVAARMAVFAIENMTCPACPLTVKTAMENVEGVQSVEIDFDAKTATVVYDASVAAVEAIAAASTNAGYPAKPAGWERRNKDQGRQPI